MHFSITLHAGQDELQPQFLTFKYKFRKHPLLLYLLNKLMQITIMIYK